MLKLSSTAEAPEGRILVVDDDGEILLLVAKFLRSNGFSVATARNGAEMKAQMQASSPDLIARHHAAWHQSLGAVPRFACRKPSVSRHVDCER